MFRFNGKNREPEARLTPEGRKIVIDVRDVTKVYQMGEIEVHALRGVTLTIEEGEFVSIMGPSGSGKSTLMNILGALDQPTSGIYILDGKDVGKATDQELATIRNQKIGFVFQNFNLLKRTTALRQVELPLIYADRVGNRHARAKQALEAVGLGARITHLPNELSGGQQQRVAIARALVTEPAMILADEPTGNLDTKSGTDVLRIFQELNRERGMTIIFVTHDAFIARHTDRVVMLRDGRVVADKRVAEPLIAGEAERPSEMAGLEDIFREAYDAPAEEFN